MSAPRLPPSPLDDLLFCPWPQPFNASPPAPIPINERQRLAALKRLEVLDTGRETAYDDLVTLASQICGTPIALVSLVDRDRQWFKARKGLDVTETPRDIAFCGHAIASADDVFLVNDAQRDARFRANPLVTGDPNVRFYAGAPIVTEAGEALGTVCVLDTEPRELSAEQTKALAALARQASSLLAMRRHLLETSDFARRQVRLTTEATLEREHGKELLDLVLQGGELGLWDLHVPSGRFTCNAHEYAMLGIDHEPEADRQVDWQSLIHADDWEPTRAAVAAHLRHGTPFYESLHRMRHRDGHWVWMLGRGVVVRRDADGGPLRIVGTHRDVSAIRAAEEAHARDVEALERATDLQRRTSQLAHVGGWELDLRDGAITWSEEVFRIHEHDEPTPPDLDRAIGVYTPDAQIRVREVIERAIADDTPWDLELPMTTMRGRPIWIRTMGRVARREAGVATHLIGAFQDITERKKIELRLADRERLLRGITDNLPVMIAEIDAKETYRFVNETYRHWFGIDPHTLIGSPVSTIGAAVYESCKQEIARALGGERSICERELALAHGKRTLHSTYVPHFDADARVAGLYAVTVDITELKETQRKLDRLARVDALTGLANRRQFDERMPEARARLARCAQRGALLYLDIDRFKQINDTFGHAVGDGVLRQFGERLRSRVRATDLAVRYAGDEFIVVLEGLTQAEQARLVADDIVEAMRVPLLVEGRTLAITTSVGVTGFGGDEESVETIVARADAALYAAKQSGRDRSAVVDG